MSEELTDLYAGAKAGADRSATQAGAAVDARRTRTDQPQPSPIARQMCSPQLRLFDKGAIQVALALTLFDTPIIQGQRWTEYFGSRVSMRNLVLGSVLLMLWRTVQWMLGLYQARLNHRAAVVLWKVPLATLLCALPMPVLLRYAEPANGSLRSALLFWFFACTLLLFLR